jgi:hypothetical protein
VSALGIMDPAYKVQLLQRDKAFGAVRGRLRPGISPEQASADLTRILNRVGDFQAKPLPVVIPLDFDIRMNSHVLGYALILAVVTTIVFGLSPVLRASGPNLAPELKSEDAVVMGHGHRRMPLRNVLVKTGPGQASEERVGAFLHSFSFATAIWTGFFRNGSLLSTAHAALRAEILISTPNRERYPASFSALIFEIFPFSSSLTRG